MNNPADRMAGGAVDSTLGASSESRVIPAMSLIASKAYHLNGGADA